MKKVWLTGMTHCIFYICIYLQVWFFSLQYFLTLIMKLLMIKQVLHKIIMSNPEKSSPFIMFVSKVVSCLSCWINKELTRNAISKVASEILSASINEAHCLELDRKQPLHLIKNYEVLILRWSQEHSVLLTKSHWLVLQTLDGLCGRTFILSIKPEWKWNGNLQHLRTVLQWALGDFEIVVKNVDGKGRKDLSLQDSPKGKKSS